jgi:hypothetical protein
MPMRTVLRSVTALVASSSLALALAVTASPAEATSRGATCELSANWKVKFSVTYDTSSSGSRYLRYAVMNSPGTIKQFRVSVRPYEINGEPAGGPLFVSTVLNPKDLQRVDINGTFGVWTYVYFEAWGGNSSCNVVATL